MSAESPAEVQFTEALRDLYDRMKVDVGYVARRIPPMIHRHGGVGTARIFLSRPEVSAGFLRVKEAGRLDLTIEHLVLRPRFTSLFSDKERDSARDRLIEHGYQATYGGDD